MRSQSTWLTGIVAASLIAMGSSAALAQLPHSTQDDIDHSTQDVSSNWNGHSTQDVLNTVPGYGLPNPNAGNAWGLGGGTEITPPSGSVPEPTSALLLLAGAALLRRRRR